MTEQHRHQSLDERGRAAGRDVLDVAARRVRPAFDPDRPTDLHLAAARTPTPGRRAFAVAAALVLVAGIAIFSTGRDGGDTTPAVTTGSPRSFVASDLPDGFSFLGAVAGSTSPGGFVPVTVYGPAAAEPMLGLLVATGSFEDVLFEAETVVVEGGEASVSVDPNGGGTVLVDVGTDTILATSPGLDTDTLVRLAGGATVEGNVARLADGVLPDGWRQLDIDPAGAPINPVFAAQSQAPVGDTSVYGARLEVGYVIDHAEAFEGEGQIVEDGGEPATATTAVVGAPGSEGSIPVDDADPGDLGEGFEAPVPRVPSRRAGAAGPPMVAVTTMSGDEARLHAATLWVGDVTEVEVRGRRALTGTDGFEGFETRLLTWEEAPGEIVRMWGTEASVDELVALAEALEPVEPDAWDDLVERTQLGDFAWTPEGDSSEIVGEGTFADGTAWVLRVEADSMMSSLSVAGTNTAGGRSSTSAHGNLGGESGELLGFEVLQAGDRSFASGLVGEGVGAVELRGVNAAVLAQPAIVEGSGRRGWAAEVGTDSFEIIALDAAGTVLDRLVIEGGALLPSTETSVADEDPPG